MSSEKKRVSRGRAWTLDEENTVLDLMRTQIDAENNDTTPVLEVDEFWPLIAHQLAASNDTFQRTPEAIKNKFGSRLGRDYSPDSHTERKVKMEDEIEIDFPNLKNVPSFMNDSSKAEQTVETVNSAVAIDATLHHLLSPELSPPVEGQLPQEDRILQSRGSVVAKNDRAESGKPAKKINSETARKPVWDPSKPGSSWSFVGSVPNNQAQSKPSAEKITSKSAPTTRWSLQEQEFIQSQLDNNSRPEEEDFRGWTKKLDHKTVPQVKDYFRRMQRKRQPESNPASGTLALSSAPHLTKRKIDNMSGSLDDSLFIPDDQSRQPPAKKPRTNLAAVARPNPASSVARTGAAPVSTAKPTKLSSSPIPVIEKVKRYAPVRAGFMPVNQAKDHTNSQAPESSAETETPTPLQRPVMISMNGSKLNTEKTPRPATSSINGPKSSAEKTPTATQLLPASDASALKTPINKSIGDIQALTTPENGIIELTEAFFNQLSVQKIQNYEAAIAKTEEAKEEERKKIDNFKSAIKRSEKKIEQLDAEIAQQRRLKEPIVTMLVQREAELSKGDGT